MKRILRRMGPFVSVALVGSVLATWALGQTESDRAAVERILAEMTTGRVEPPARETDTAEPSGGDGGVLPRMAEPAVPPPSHAVSLDGGVIGAPSVAPNIAAAREPIEAARKALERADGARRAGDVRHAELLEGLALEWAETARDVLRASAAESEAAELETSAAQAGLRAERQRALLEEAIARRGRAEAEMLRLSSDAGAARPSSPAVLAKPKPAPPRAPAAKGAR